MILFAFTSVASAGTITGSGQYLYYNAVAGENNNIAVSYYSPTTIEIEDFDEPLSESSSSCTKVGSVVRCSAGASTNFRWNLGDGNDYFYGTEDIAVKDTVDGGAGADTMSCGAGADQIDYSMRTLPVFATPSDGWESDDGELGEHDVISDWCDASLGGSGPDTLFGSAIESGRIYGNDGNDTIKLFKGSNEICDSNNAPLSQAIGGAGDDRLYATEGRNRLSGQDGSDVAIGGDGCDNVEGAAGSDTLIGGRGNDFVMDHAETSSSNVNLLDGGDGTDMVISGFGSDTLILADDDREMDSWACNYGTDFLLSDTNDYEATVWEQNPPTGACEKTIQRP